MVSSNFPCKCTRKALARSHLPRASLFLEFLWKEARGDTYLIWTDFIKFKYDFYLQVFVRISDRPQACRPLPLFAQLNGPR
ncbi:hypothetical protein SAMN05892877_109248 [Rhizobium subbaraonis]|uniref:Uncharacterized protein n=1 Tax=Rhizobium subbaraonis TaxID=908946 RepID=A0A285UJX5_9HYPH|nr:hypothetical protein SAMN05892877_109248 [Rhizobium subbaraonis]